MGLTDSTSYDVHVGKRLQKSLPFEAVEGLQKLELQLPSGYLNLFNIAMENGPFIVDFPIKNGDFP